MKALCYYLHMLESKLHSYLSDALSELGITDGTFVIERPGEMAHGDFATNAAMVNAKKVGKNPRALAEEIKAKLDAKQDADILAVEVAGPGFINIKCTPAYFMHALQDALATSTTYGNNETLKGKKVVVEYTDPNPFKEFHIGHMMTNTIGESISRIIEASGAETRRVCYQGDTGIHVASAIWGMMQEDLPADDAPITEKAKFLGRAYARGAVAGNNDPMVRDTVVGINRKIHERSDAKLNQLYDRGRAWSLEYFETIYKRLGTAHGDCSGFDHYFFESVTGVFGKEVVLAHPEIFVQSDGAIVYKGDEEMGLHTRVFINKEGLPTYEAKELGLAKIKYDTWPYDVSIVITANEVKDYFKVLLDAMHQVFPELAAKTIHMGHGMLRLPTGKMSSRTGDVITAESLIDDVKERARAKNTDTTFTETDADAIAEKVAIAAIKYAILRQASGKDVIFDVEQSLSFEGDSGPYLQYTYARTRSLLAKAEGKTPSVGDIPPADISSLHKYILRFPEVVLRASDEREPHHVATYLIELAREFNSFYGNTIILDGGADEPYKLALVAMTSTVLKRGLDLLGIEAPEHM